jgi:ATPase subunit of ABC transporter with duplicated ATPase domains
MSLFSASRIAFRHPSAPADLFTDATFAVAPGDRVALVGPNGAGKTTLMKLMAGAIAPTAGTIVRRRGLLVQAMDQVPDAPADRLLLDHVVAAEPDGAAWRAAMVLEGLGLAEALHDAPFGTLSAGQRARAMLAALLVAPADLLVLDEPTNHLDAAGRAWLEAWLPRQEAAVVVVSHDRAFLEAAAARTFELRGGALAVHEGGYASYREAKALATRQAWQAYEGQQRRHEAAARAAAQRTGLAREIARTPDAPGLGDKAFYRHKAAKIERTAKIITARAAREPEAPKPVLDDAIPIFDWDFVPRSGDLPLAARGLAKGYGGRTLFEGLTFDLGRGERLAVVGPNGAGKTTLVRVLLGEVAPDAGEVAWGHGARPGWFGQEAEQLDFGASALENLLAVRPDPARARLLLACLRIRGDQAFQRVGTMSAGERAKVALARLLLGGANVLLLDEPTNHLDLDAREAIEATLATYPGAIVLVSHDRRFVEAIATRELGLGG